MTRDMYAWIDPWAALDGPRIVRDLEWSPEDIAAMQRPGVVQFVPNRIKNFLFEAPEASTFSYYEDGVSEWDSPAPIIHEMTITEARQHMGSPAPTPDRSVPIWLMAIIMLGIAFGAPMIVGWVW